MKKIITVLMLMIFVVSLAPLALAEEHDQREDRIDQAVEGVKKVQKRVKIVQENFEESRRRYHNAQDKFKQAHDLFKEHKGRLDELRKQARCQEDSTECREHKGKLKSGVKTHLIKKLDVMFSSLERLESKVQEVKISEEEKTAALATIAELKTDVQSLTERIEGLLEDGSAEEYKSAINEIKEAWKVIKKEQRSILAGLMNSRMDNLVEKHREYINGLGLRIEDLREAGKDISELEGIKDEFVTNVEKLAIDHSYTQNLWKQVKSGDAELSEWREAQLRVRTDLKTSKQTLRKFLKSYRNLKETTSQE